MDSKVVNGKSHFLFANCHSISSDFASRNQILYMEYNDVGIIFAGLPAIDQWRYGQIYLIRGFE